MVMGKSWKSNGNKSCNFVIIHGILSILPVNFIKFVSFSPNLRNIASVRMSAFFNKMSQKQNLSKEMIMENRETVIEKSWKKFLQSLWEP